MQSYTPNNYARNLRVTQTPKAIRNNQYDEYDGKFVIRPTTSNDLVNNQNICTTFKMASRVISGVCEDSGSFSSYDPNIITNINACYLGADLPGLESGFDYFRFTWDPLINNTRGYNGYQYEFRREYNSDWIDPNLYYTSISINSIEIGNGQLEIDSFQVRIKPVKWLSTPTNIIEVGQWTESPFVSSSSDPC